MSAIYLIGLVGELSGPITLPVVPGIGCQMPDNAIELAQELAAPAEGFVWAMIEGDAVQLADHRGTVYGTADGSPQQHAALGNLPAGLTAQKWPGLFYVWEGASWVLDEAAQLEATKAAERLWRNAQISVTDYLVLPDYPISADQRAELYAYRQALRDWPAAGQFPGQQNRPEPPGWIAELPQ